MKQVQHKLAAVPEPIPDSEQGLPTDRPYLVKRLFIQAELEFYDPSTGKVTGSQVTNPAALFEADFPDGLMGLLAKGGLKPTPKE